MLLTITTTHHPATDLGYLLHKHPGRVQAFDVTGGRAHVFYPQADEAGCTAALLVEIDPIELVRGRSGPSGEGLALGQYVNDRPYAASSLLAVAMNQVFHTALTGRCDARPDLAAADLPLVLRVPALPCRGGADLAARLFEPLGWQVAAAPVALDAQLPGWGDSRYVDLTLTGSVRLSTALSHLYVLLPVLDDAKHYWVSTEEVDKLVRAGTGWLATHPEKALISRRYLAHQGGLTRSALARLAEVDDTDVDELDAVPAEDAAEDTSDSAVTAGGPQPPATLAAQRREAVLMALRSFGARRVADLGCGEGALVAALLADDSFTEIVATDVSTHALAVAARRLRLDRMSERQRARLRLFQSSLTYRDERIAGLDAAVLMEVVEHVDPPRLAALADAVFGAAAPATVIVTTPNVEHNVRYESLAAGAMRHRDHRFEWTRAEFGNWAAGVAARYGYGVAHLGVGTDDAEVGPPTQLAVFTRLTS